MAKIKAGLLKLGWYQIIGGTVGMMMILYSVFSQAEFPDRAILIYCIAFLFFAYSVYCGILCVRNKDRALVYSLINQFLQLFGIAVFGFAFAYVAGLYMSVGLDLSTGFFVKFNFGTSKFDFNINRELEQTDVNFNLVAFGLIYWIDKLIKKTKAEKERIDIASIGQ